jgi:hypothetical protein
MWVPLDTIPDERPLSTIIGRCQVRRAGEVPMQVLLVHVGGAKGYEDW